LLQKKVVASKYDESRGVQKARADDEPLDDPIAEKLRQQRLVEEADYAATMELFGNSRDLDGFIPKTSGEFEELGKLVAIKHLMPHSGAKASLYKGALKSLLHAALHDMSAGDVKDLETCVAGIRSEKLKAEKNTSMGKKQLKKATLNVGKSGGSAGLDDYVFDDPLEDDYDFM
jgi:translation initiation factor 3 subunit J